MWSNIGIFLIFSAISTGFAYPRGESGKVVGGAVTDIEDVPYQLALYRYHDRISGCGGTIVSEYAVITAAHCVIGLVVDDVTFSAGSNFNNRSGSIHRADWIVIHFDYDFATLQNDIAFIKVIEPFVFSSQVQAANLPNAVPAGGIPVTVSGWGKSNIGGAALQSQTLATLSLGDCQARYAEFDLHPTVDMICAEPGQGEQGPCDGDAGGPLVLTADNTLVGVFTWANGCGLTNYPSVYTNIAYFRDFIDENLSYIRP